MTVTLRKWMLPMGGLLVCLLLAGMFLHSTRSNRGNELASDARQDLSALPIKPGIQIKKASLRTESAPEERLRFLVCFADSTRFAPEQKQRVADELLQYARNSDARWMLGEEQTWLALFLLGEYRPIPRVREYLRSVAIEPSSYPERRERALRSWSWHLQPGYRASDVATMLKFLQSSDPLVRMAAIDACSYTRMRECRPALRQLLRKSKNAQVRGEIRRCLEWIAGDGQQARGVHEAPG